MLKVKVLPLQFVLLIQTRCNIFQTCLTFIWHVHQRRCNRAVLGRPAPTTLEVPPDYRVEGRPIAFLRCQLATAQCFLLCVSAPRRWEQCASLNSVPKSQHTNPAPVSTGFDRKPAEATKPHILFFVCSRADYFPVEVFRLHGTDGRMAASSVYM